VLVDMDLEQPVRAEDLASKCGWSPYEGRTLKGWPVLTMVRGRIVARDGRVTGKPGFGRFIRREA